MVNLKTGKHFADAPTMTRGGFLKGILASGIAPSITLGAIGSAGPANASVGSGMMRNVGARTAAMFGGKKPYDEEVNYIQTDLTKTQYIDTGVQGMVNLGIDADIKVLAIQSDNVFFGWLSTKNLVFGQFTQSSSRRVFSTRWGAGSSGIGFSIYGSWFLGERYILRIRYSSNLQVFTVGDNTYSYNKTATNPEYLNNYISTVNWNGTPSRDVAVSMAIYSFKMYDSYRLLRDFIPVIKNNVAYLYDRCGSICPLTGTSLYANAGTGAFTWG